MAAGIKTNTLLTLSITVSFIIFALATVILVNANMREQALIEAKSKARLMLDRNLATHTYFTKDLKPSLFKTMEPLQSPDYFDPNWMSSTYAVLKMEKYFHHFNLEPFYYKESAINARSPQNEADDYERRFINDLSTDPKLTEKSGVRFFGGQPFLDVIRRGEAMEESCLRCHSTPQQAPGELVNIYGPEKSFNRKLGDVVQAISIRIPLEAAYGNANRFSLRLSALLVGLSLVIFVALFVLIKRFIIGPLNAVKDQAVLIAQNPGLLGKLIAEPKNREIRDLVDAFNQMSTELKRSYEKLDEKVLVRTEELQLSTEKLLLEGEKRKTAENSLRESERKLRSILSASPVGIVQTQQSRIIWANPAWEGMFGYNGQEYVGQHTGTMYHSESEYQRIHSLLYDNIVMGGVSETDAEFKRKDGASFYGNIRINLLNPENPSEGTISVIADISEKMATVEALRKSEERYRTVANFNHDWEYWIDSDGNFLYCSPSCERITGYSAQEFLDDPDLANRILHPDDRLRMLDHHLSMRNIQIEAIGETDFRIIRRDGETRWIGHVCRPVFKDNREWMGRRGSNRDITDRVKAEQQKKCLEEQLIQAQKMEAVGNLAGGIAHDFNNILQVVLGFSDLALMDKGYSGAHGEHLLKIKEAARRGADLVRGLMIFSRKSDHKPRPLDMNQHIAALRKMLERTMPKNIDIELELEEHLSVINADPTAMDQILMNLAVNAKDAMPGGGKLTLKTANVTLVRAFTNRHVEVLAGTYVLLTVCDTGCGMDIVTQEHMFEPFFTTKGIGRGTGLGLAVVYGIVQQHHGYITCESIIGRGTTFGIYFPVLEFETRLEGSSEEKVEFREGTETILAVDDEEMVRKLMGNMLTKAGYKAILASDGTEAVAIYQSQHNEIDLILLDLMMPVMDGMECLKKLLEIDQSAKVVIISGYTADGSIADTIAAGARAAIEKPFTAADILKVVREVLGENSDGKRHCLSISKFSQA